MVTPTDPIQPHETHVDDDVQLLSETLEEVLAYSGDKADQKYVELKTRAEAALEDVKNRISQASDNYYYRAKQAVYLADDYVQENPWHGVGIGASVGLVVGLLLARR
ncbi:stress response protein ElaB [Acerihabitans arboris]|uniref:Stress response protein ElaB n=1 Tax=Acerihabitans arboris TaxID=2691583 RepID=A0A845SQS4_9GAMM|nr:stress response protein ElaB [Acerihabitans arboris]NDL65274.1 stress response protein ElaB [Acerihabitans arboris]